MARSSCSMQDPTAFLEAGNSFVGGFGITSLNTKLEWEGTGNILSVEEGATLKAATLQMLGNARISIGASCEVTGIVRADKGSEISIGAQTRINRPSTLRSCEGGKIMIGSGCLFANVLIRNSDLHAVVDLSTNTRVNNGADIVVGDHVWLAEDVYVYKGVVIGANTVVASRSTVLKSLPSNCVAAGTPAKVVKTNTTWYRSLNPARWI